jgi:4-amino-4-deoxy-L-arabinose transferase-like glycosyltransferase
MPPLSRRDALPLLLLVGWGLAWLAPELGHEWIHNWDEALHQAATRGTFATPLAPHIYREPLHTPNPHDFWAAGVWLHKPPMPFWLGAALMHLTGVTPLALRLVSLLGVLCTAVCLYLLVRGLAGRALAGLTAAGFLALPFTWLLTQGFMFGDATDTSLTGALTLSVLLLCRAVERGPAQGAARGAAQGAARGMTGGMALAGAVLGGAYLCKSALALAPLGVAGVLWALARLRLGPGPSTRGLLAFLAAFALVAAPWNLYAWHTWPEPYLANLRNSFLGHLTDAAGEDVGPWRRPWDFTLAHFVPGQLRPVPMALAVLALACLWGRALRRREAVPLALALWLTATWTVHSLTSAKAPALAWNALPAAFGGLALLLHAARRSLPLALGVLGAVASGPLLPHLPALARLRQGLPVETFHAARTEAGVVEGLLLTGGAVALGGALALAGAWARRRLRSAQEARGGEGKEGGEARAVGALRAGAGGLAVAAAAALLLVQVPLAHAAQAAGLRPRFHASSTADVGRALDAVLPERSVLYLDVDAEPPGAFLAQDAIFWSGRMAYLGPPDAARAQARGLRPYLLSPAAERFAPVEGVPPHAWLRAYDALRPLPAPAPLPAGVTPLDVEAGPLHVLGWAVGPASGGRARWALYVRAAAGPAPLRVAFHTEQGAEEVHRVAPHEALRTPARLADAPWFVLPVVGPPRAQVRALGLGVGRAPVPLPPP